jgi:hypothetical protein
MESGHWKMETLNAEPGETTTVVLYKASLPEDGAQTRRGQ